VQLDQDDGCDARKDNQADVNAELAVDRATLCVGLYGVVCVTRHVAGGLFVGPGVS
jgi:hypothetical protein